MALGFFATDVVEKLQISCAAREGGGGATVMAAGDEIVEPDSPADRRPDNLSVRSN